MKIFLPDVNILLPLVAEGHTHHSKALEWFGPRADESVAICRVTQMALLRLLTNQKVMRTGVCSTQRAWEISNEILADRRIFFQSEPPGLEGAWAAMMRHPAARSSSWTDAYLAAFAQQHDYEMVTFDRDFQRWSDLAVSVLV